MEKPYKEEFRAIFQQHVTRRGGDQLLEWLENTDFYTAPASTKFHCACEFGLVMHSLNVYKVLREKYFEEGDSEESFALCGLLHTGIHGLVPGSHRHGALRRDGRPAQSGL